jgi:hypothetical protein
MPINYEPIDPTTDVATTKTLLQVLMEPSQMMIISKTIVMVCFSLFMIILI